MLDLESDQNVDEEIETVLGPYRKLLSDHEKLHRLRAEKHLHQRVTDLNQVESFKTAVCEIERKTSARLKVIHNNMSGFKLTLQEPAGIDCLPIPYDLHKQMIATVEGMVSFSNNFPQALQILNDTPAGGQDIRTPLEQSVAHYDAAISSAKLELENITELHNGVESMLTNEENQN